MIEPISIFFRNKEISNELHDGRRILLDIDGTLGTVIEEIEKNFKTYALRGDFEKLVENVSLITIQYRIFHIYLKGAKFLF